MSTLGMPLDSVLDIDIIDEPDDQEHVERVAQARLALPGIAEEEEARLRLLAKAINHWSELERSMGPNMPRPVERIFVIRRDHDLAKKEARWEQAVAALLKMFSPTTPPEHD